MELNNFEKDIQQKLNNREINPSANSWDRLNAMLSVEEKPKKKRFSWLPIAASFVVFASLGYYFFNSHATDIPSDEPIIKESVIVNVEKNEENISPKESETLPKEVLVTSDKVDKTNKMTIQLKHATIHNPQSKSINQRVSNINQSQEEDKNRVQLVENLKPISQNQELRTNKYISAEKLLAAVSGEDFKIDKTKNKDIKKRISVNPNALLSNAETELNQTYKETALEKLSKNLNNIKTVLVNRNYEE